MKKTIAIFFIFLFMTSATHMSELLKLPEFIGHYIEHKNDDAKMSFFTFLSIHYMSGDVKDADHAKDMKLPFKTLINNSNATVLYIPGLNLFTIVQPAVSIVKPKTPAYSTLYTSRFASAIFKPPKKSC